MNYNRVLITGGAGFIGSAISEYLLSAGKDVAVYDNLSFGKLENIDTRKVEFFGGDILDEEKFKFTLIQF